MVTLTVLDDSNIDSIIGSSELPMFVDLWAEWCMPCKRVEPILEDLADEYQGKMRFGKLNVDENPKIAEKYNIFSIPMFIILDKELNIIESFIGAVPKKKFVEHIETALEKN